MARAIQIMQSGTPASQAVAINGGNAINTAISAAGTTQATATTLTGGVNMIGTAAAGSGVILPQGQPGDLITVYNGGANAVYVYPPTSAKFGALSANTPAVLPTGSCCDFRQISTTQFIANLTA